MTTDIPKKMAKKYTTNEQYNMKADLWAKRWFPDIDYKEYDWVADKSDQIAKHILETYEKPETVRAHINALAMIINRYHPDTEKVNKYKTMTQQYRKQIEATKSEQDNDYVPYETILKIGTDMYQKAIQTKDKKMNIVGLVILLNTLHPPMRNQIYDMPIVKQDSVPNGVMNYTYRDNNGRWHIVVNVTEKKRTSSNDDMVSVDLSKIIDHSIRLYPRDYLVSSWFNPKNNLSEGTIRNNLRELEPALGVNIFRHSYIINFYEHKQTYKDRENLARMMLHGVALADFWYDTYKGNKITVEESKEQTQPTVVRKHPPPPPRPVGVEPFTGLSRNQLAPVKPPKPILVEQKEEKVGIPVQFQRTVKKTKQTPEERKAKNTELKKIYRAKNRALLVQKEMERRARNKQP